jgi:hypothetical protein
MYLDRPLRLSLIHPVPLNGFLKGSHVCLLSLWSVYPLWEHELTTMPRVGHATSPSSLLSLWVEDTSCLSRGGH